MFLFSTEDLVLCCELNHLCWLNSRDSAEPETLYGELLPEITGNQRWTVSCHLSPECPQNPQAALISRSDWAHSFGGLRCSALVEEVWLPIWTGCGLFVRKYNIQLQIVILKPRVPSLPVSWGRLCSLLSWYQQTELWCKCCYFQGVYIPSIIDVIIESTPLSGIDGVMDVKMRAQQSLISHCWVSLSIISLFYVPVTGH